MAEEKETKKPKLKKTSQKWKMYEKKGDKLEKQKTCPKCGAGVFMAKHKDRHTCGSCSYSEFLLKKTEEKKKI